LSSCLLSKKLKIKLYRKIISPFLCGHETWSLTLKEEHNEDLLILHASPNDIIMVITPRRMRWAGHTASLEEMKMHADFSCKT
jgi:hypothetical protein